MSQDTPTTPQLVRGDCVEVIAPYSEAYGLKGTVTNVFADSDWNAVLLSKWGEWDFRRQELKLIKKVDNG